MYQPSRQQTTYFSQPESGELKVWRYLDLPKLIYALERRVLVLTRLDLLGDSYEAVPSRADRQYRRDLIRRDPSFANIAGNWGEWFTRGRGSLRTRLYASCWHINEDESEAMWRLYCGASQGLALRTTYAQLDSSTASEADLYIGLVNYIDYERDYTGFASALDPAIFKRRAFAHEREVRLVKCDYSRRARKPRVLELPWDAEGVVENIFVNPYAKQWYFETIRYAIARFAPKLSERIRWSEIRRDPWQD